jgi:hypothetical protein
MEQNNFKNEGNHLTDRMLISYLLSDLSENEAEVVQVHLANCSECAEMMESLSGIKQELEVLPKPDINTESVIEKTTELYKKAFLQRSPYEVKLDRFTLVFLKVGEGLRFFESLLFGENDEPQLVPAVRDALVEINQTTAEGRVVMELLDEEDKACAGVKLELDGPSKQIITTDENGRIELKNLAPGSYKVKIKKD